MLGRRQQVTEVLQHGKCVATPRHKLICHFERSGFQRACPERSRMGWDTANYDKVIPTTWLDTVTKTSQIEVEFPRSQNQGRMAQPSGVLDS